MPVRGDGLYLPIEIPKKRKDLPVKQEFEYNPIRSFSTGNAYDVAFCYPHPLYHRPFMVKGGHQDIRKYLKKLNIPMIAHHTLYYKGRHRRIFGLYGIDSDIYITRKYVYDNGISADKLKITNKKYELYHLGNTSFERKVLAEFKRVPRRWIRELNLYVTTERRSFHDI